MKTQENLDFSRVLNVFCILDGSRGNGSDARNHSAAGSDSGPSGNFTPTGPRLDPLQDRGRRTAELCAAGGDGSGTGRGRSILFFGHRLGARPRVSPLFMDGRSATVARGSALSALGGVGQLWLR